MRTCPSPCKTTIGASDGPHETTTMRIGPCSSATRVRGWQRVDSISGRRPCGARPIRRQVASSGALDRARRSKPTDPISSRPPACPIETFPQIHLGVEAAKRPPHCRSPAPPSPFGSGHVCLAELPDTTARFGHPELSEHSQCQRQRPCLCERQGPHCLRACLASTQNLRLRFSNTLQKTSPFGLARRVLLHQRT